MTHKMKKPDPLSSTVSLAAFAIYKRTPGIEEIEPLYGCSAARIGSDGVVEILADSVPFNSILFKNMAPKAGFGLLLLYGRDMTEELQAWRAKARALGAEFAYTEFEVEVGMIEAGLVDRDLLKKYKTQKSESDSNPDSNGPRVGFLNVRRMKQSLQLDVLSHFQSWVAAEPGAKETDMDRLSKIATRPDLFDPLLNGADTELSDLDVLVIPVADDPAVFGKMRQLAYVKPGTIVRSVYNASTDGRIVLPSWMSDTKQAAAYRKQSLSA